MSGSWGTELWDKYPELTSHLQNGIDFLENSVANFIRERGKIEAEYAKSLRTLIKRYAPREVVKNPDDEYTHIKGFKQMLKEVGFQAGQHEVLAECFSKDEYKTVLEKCKRLKEVRKKNMKESDRLSAELRQAFKAMDVSKEKFRKAYDEHTRAVNTFERSNADGSITKNEITKLRQIAMQRGQQSDEAKGKFASTLVKTNEFQQCYYNDLFPRVLNELQELEKDRIEIMRTTVLTCLSKEREVQPIITKCHESIDSAMRNINPDEDTELVVERFKSGDVPPGDFKFDEMQDPQDMLRPDVQETSTNLNLYPKKKELERQMDEVERELNKKQKELASMQQMQETYKKNPKFGSAQQFTAEIGSVNEQIKQLDARLRNLQGEHAFVEERLEAIRSRSPMPGSLTGTLPAGASPRLMERTRVRGSQSSSRSSLRSSNSVCGANSSGGSNGADAVYETPPPYAREDSFDAYEEIPLPPPPPVHHQPTAASSRAVALYAYAGESLQESNIPMAEGEEFEVVEGDSDGWTRVRRLCDVEDEGYVPTAFLKLL